MSVGEIGSSERIWQRAQFGYAQEDKSRFVVRVRGHEFGPKGFCEGTLIKRRAKSFFYLPTAQLRSKAESQISCLFYNLRRNPVNRCLRFCSKIDISGSQVLDQFGYIRLQTHVKSIESSDQFLPLGGE